MVSSWELQGVIKWIDALGHGPPHEVEGSELSSKGDRIAFFTMCVYRWTSKQVFCYIRDLNLCTPSCTHKPMFPTN